MRFEYIEINNFRQYFKKNIIDLSISNEKNIILIGGKNGYGKTNFLLSVVWCLYGEKITQIDENFKKEIRKERNYSSFMERSLNSTAREKGEKEFSVSVKVSDLRLPFETKEFDFTEVTITRAFNIENFSESLSVFDMDGKLVYEDEEDKFNFINDFIIPIDAAKFVFFDGEKISEVANLSIKDEGSFINDALNKVLGLDIYEQLTLDLNKYIQSLKKHSLTGKSENQVNDIDRSIDNKLENIDALEDENTNLNNEIELKEHKIVEYEKIINESAPQEYKVNKDELIAEKLKIQDNISNLENEFHALGEVIPLVMLSGKLHQVQEHLKKQQDNETAENNVLVNFEKIEKFIEFLFNEPPQPENSTLSFKDKIFFYEKAKELGGDIFGGIESNILLDFEHDLTKSDKQLIDNSLTVINSYNQKSIEEVIVQLNSSENRFSEINSILSKVDADQVDEYISEIINKCQRLKQDVKSTIKKIGSNIESINRELGEVERKKAQLDSLMKRIEVSNENQIKINTAQSYIDVLNTFIESQKQAKKTSLESNILKELRSLMHKMKVSDNSFISEVVVNILPDGHGMKVFLYDDNDEELKKESLSQGEKQLYISSLIKAILKESLYPLPIFIDTPLGRLDDEHITNILQYYYPTLSDQVVLLSTNNEITPTRYHKIESVVAKAFLLDHDGRNTKFVEGYFKGIKND